MDKATGKVAAGPDLVSRGFVYVRESEDLMVEARKIVQKTLDDIESKKIKEWSTIKSSIRNDLRSFLYGNIKRNPMILPIIMEI
jgi:ribonuclease J